MRDKVFYIICFGFLFGILWRSLIFINVYFTILFSVIATALILFFSLVSKNKWGILTSVFILAFSFGIFRFHSVDVPAPSVFKSQVGQKVNFSGEIIDEPSLKENNQQLTVLITSRGWTSKILLSANLGEYYKYGDEISFIGTLKKPENFVTDTGKEFDYVNYLRKDGILYVMSYPKIEIMPRGNGNVIKSALFFVKEKFLEKVNFAISAPENLLMGGLILGEKSSFDQSMRQNFVDTGTIHIVALSGYNVTIVAEWVMKLFSFLPSNFGFGLGILGILFFVIMAGGKTTT